ncbi:MAG: FHA domain-containing protein [Polyangia bacterium]
MRAGARSGRIGLALAVALGLGATGAAARADGSGLHIRHLLSPEPGKLQALVETDSTVPGLASAGAADFALLLNGGQPARNVIVRKNGDRGGLLTLVVLDDSGSYRSRAGATLARPLLADYAATLGPGDRIGLVVFGTDAKVYPIQTSGAAVLGDLGDPQRQSAAGRANLRATNLLSGLSAALGVLRKEQEEKRAQPGLAEIVLLTDAGDEAGVDTSDWRSVLADSEARGVRVSAIISDMATSAGGAQRLASLTRLRELSDKTQGLYDNSNSLAVALAALRTARDRQKSWLSVEGELCGISARPEGPATADARVEFAPGGSRRAWSETRSFRPQWTPASAAPCPSLVPCAPACPQWQQCTAGQCEPRACTAGEQCGPTARCTAGRCARAADARPPWLWALLAGGLLVLLAGLLTALLLKRRRGPHPEPKGADEGKVPPVEPSPAKAAEPASAVAGAVAAAAAVAPLLDPLPETHLVAIGGRVTIGEKWRLHKAKVYVGGSSSPEDGNDIVFPLPQVSSKHALFESYPSGALWLTDLKARNGTYVNGRRLEPGERVALRPGDQVKLSQQLILEVQRPGAGKPAPEAEAPPEKLAPAPAPPPERGDAGAPRPPLDKKKTVFDPGNR